MTKISEFDSPTTTLKSTDIVSVVESPGGTPKNVKATLQDIHTLDGTNIVMSGTETVDGRDVSVDGTKLDGVEDNADKHAGKHTIFVPGAAMFPAVAQGCSSVTTSSVTNVDYRYLEFSNLGQQWAQFEMVFPKSWNLGTLTYQVYWGPSDLGNSGGVSWEMKGYAVSNDETIFNAVPPKWGTEVIVDDDGATNVQHLKISPESSAVTLGETPSDGDYVFLRISRDPGQANDTYDQNARLYGIRLFYTTDAGNDE